MRYEDQRLLQHDDIKELQRIPNQLEPNLWIGVLHFVYPAQLGLLNVAIGNLALFSVFRYSGVIAKKLHQLSPPAPPKSINNVE